jgi:Family of unknown function (DUF6489)
MKIKIDIDCTPQEARAFLGLPDVEPVQKAVLGKVQERLLAYLDARDPEALLKLWLPGGLEELGQLQGKLWQQLLGGLSAGVAPGAKNRQKR